MAFARPSLQEIIDRIQTDIGGQLGAPSATLRRAFTRVISRAFGGAVHLLYGYLDYISRQIIPDTAEGDELVRWANIFGITRKPADFAEGPVTFTGTNGVFIPTGYQIQRSDGLVYTTIADATIASGTASVQVRAVVAGSIGNLAAGQALQGQSPIANLSSVVTAGVGGLAGGDDVESIEALRARLLLKIRQPPQGGSKSDYEQWALEVPGVTRVFVYGPGEIDDGVPDDATYLPEIGQVYIYFVRDGDADIIPTVPQVAEVQAYIDARRPVTATPLVFAPTPVEIDFEIAITPNSAAVRAAIEAELLDLFMREGFPGNTIFLSQINEAISIAAGEQDHTLIAPVADIELASDEIAVLGSFIFTGL